MEIADIFREQSGPYSAIRGRQHVSSRIEALVTLLIRHQWDRLGRAPNGLLFQERRLLRSNL